MRDKVTIVVVGDAQVGKSSLISTLLMTTFNDRVPPVVGEVRIPPESSPEQVVTVIVDTSSRPEDEETRKAALQRADVVCIVYDVSRPATFDSLRETWLPALKDMGLSVPIVLVGNKIDTRGGNLTNTDLTDQIQPLMSDYTDVETCVECSAKSVVNIPEVFFFAQFAVLYPTAPIYDQTNRQLTPKCVDALKRIFKLCDSDRDNLLSDGELNEFQRKCFNTPLEEAELQGVKDVVRQHQPDGVTESDMLTEAGFIFLNMMFIQRGRSETSWTVLRTFGYTDNLQLREDLIAPQVKVGKDQVVELSPKGYEFLTDLFRGYDKDSDGALSPSELTNTFAAVDGGNPWPSSSFPSSTHTNSAGNVTLQGFLAQWAMQTVLDHRVTLRTLAYLGMSDPKTAIKVTRRAVSKGKASARNVFQAFVIGAPGVGKSALLDSLAGKSFDEKTPVTSVPRASVSALSVDSEPEKYLVAREFGSEQQATLDDPAAMAAADVLCLVYDSSDAASFKFVADIPKKFPKLPSVFIATKSDKPAARWPPSGALDSDGNPMVTPGVASDGPSLAELSPLDVTAAYNIAKPVEVSAKEGNLTNVLFAPVLGVAQKPWVVLPMVDRKAGSRSDGSSGGMLKVGLAVGAAAGVAGLIWWWRNKNN